jgi:predicted ArsR family transcriptional regulator
MVTGHLASCSGLTIDALDKLISAGLLTADYANLTGLRRVGRVPKVYEPAGLDVQLSIPPREYGLLADILLEAVLRSDDHADARQAALDAAARQGRLLGEAERSSVRGRLGAERALTVAEQVLERHGFEPVRCGATLLRLGNCPFHPYATRAADLVCAINHAFLTGFLEGVEASTVRASLVPRPGACCVEIGAAPSLTA